MLHVPAELLRVELALGVAVRVDALAGSKSVLERVLVRGERVREEVGEEELAEAAAGLRRPERLLEPRDLLRPLVHLSRRLVEFPEPLVDSRARLRRALEAAVDLRIELGEPPVHRLNEACQPAVDRGV